MEKIIFKNLSFYENPLNITEKFLLILFNFIFEIGNFCVNVIQFTFRIFMTQ